MPIKVTLDEVMARRGISLTQLSDGVDITLANLSILKTGKAKAMRFSTLEAICNFLECQPGKSSSSNLSNKEAVMPTISVLRLNMLRAAYLLLVVGLGVTVWPEIVTLTATWSPAHGVVMCMLGAMSALAVLGLRQPLRMLPILFFEMGWKVLWLSRVAAPAWANGKLDAATVETALECFGVVIFFVVVPWSYVFETYVKTPADPWLAARANAT